MDMEPKTTSYAGLLDQSAFKQWYKYLKSRAIYRYETEEVSFLMSKPPFYFRDYEIMEIASKMTTEDQTVLSEIFHDQRTEQLDFEKDDYGTFEKRIIRVQSTEDVTRISYLITVPWKILGKSKTAKLKIQEEKRIVNSEEEIDMLRKVGQISDKLLTIGFFRCGRVPLDIYREVEERMQWSPVLRPKYVKQVLYQQINAGNLSLKTHHNQLHFQEQNGDFVSHSVNNEIVNSF